MSAPMVRAILEGRKTQTRRMVKAGPHSWDPAVTAVEPSLIANAGDLWDFRREMASPVAMRCPYGVPGDRLWVRETWFPDPPIDGSWPGDISWQDERRIDGVPAHYRKPKHCIFAASWDGIDLRWRPGSHMPRWASRITLEVTGVRVERLHAITDADAAAEGVVSGRIPADDYGPERIGYVLGRDDGKCVLYPSERRAFEVGWSLINGQDSWDANPWVWVVAFRRVEAQERAA